MEADTASSEQVLGTLTTKMQVRKADNFASIFSVKDPPLLCKAEAEQVRHLLRALAEVRTYTVAGGRVSEWLLTLVEQNEVFPTFPNGTASLQSILSKRAAKSNFPHYNPTTPKALLLPRGTVYVSSCMQKRRLQAKLH